MLTSSLQMFLEKEGGGRLKNHLIKASTGMFGLRVASIGLSMVISVLLARLLGKIGYGTYAYAMAWIDVLEVLVLFGLDTLLVRHIAAYQTQSAWGLMRGLLQWANLTAMVTSCGVVLLVLGVTWLLRERFNFQMISALWIALCMLPLLAFNGPRRGALQGLHHVLGGRLPELIIRPLSFIALLGCGYVLLGEGLNMYWALSLHVMAVGVACLTGVYLLHKVLPQGMREALPSYQRRAWLRNALSLILIDGMNKANNRADILILGAMAGAEAVGIYNVASRGTQLIIFIQMAINTTLGPTISSLYAAGNLQRLQRVITKSQRWALVFSLTAAGSLILFGEEFLSLFGEDFRQGYEVLAILSLGWAVNAACGGVAGHLLVMTGYERGTAIGIGATAILNITLNIILIPRWGAKGAAISMAITMIVRNLLLMLWVYRKLGIDSTALGRIRSKREAGHRNVPPPR